MTSPDQPTEPPEPPSVESTQDGIASIERAFLRLTFWQTLLSLAGVFTGAIALYAALNESQAVREQTAASVWPYVQFMIDDTDDGSAAHFALSFENVGVGPARMGGLQLVLDGRAVTSWNALTALLQDSPAQVGVDYGQMSVSRRVIAPGDTVVAFRTDDRRLALLMQGAVYSGRVGLRYCYCSIFDDCWLSRSWESPGNDTHRTTDECPDYAEAEFRD